LPPKNVLVFGYLGSMPALFHRGGATQKFAIQELLPRSSYTGVVTQELLHRSCYTGVNFTGVNFRCLLVFELLQNSYFSGSSKCSQ
jgi:hypothetical protein